MENGQNIEKNPGDVRRLAVNPNSTKRKRISKIVDFAVPADHRINLKECEKKDKYLDLARELKKLWNMKVTIVPIVIGSLGTILKRPGRLGNWWTSRDYPNDSIAENGQNADTSPGREETCCHPDSSEKPSANTDVKNSNGVNNNNNNNIRPQDQTL